MKHIRCGKCDNYLTLISWSNIDGDVYYCPTDDYEVMIEW